MLENETILSFIDKVSKKSPVVPSGGSVLALCAACASALGQLTANVTLNKKGYEDLQDEMQGLSQLCYQFSQRFITYIDGDAQAFQEVVLASRLQAETQAQKDYREKSIEVAYKKAAWGSYELAQHSHEFLEAIYVLLEKGNPNALGDAIVARELLKVVIRCSLSNAQLNLEHINDRDFSLELSLKMDHIRRNLGWQ